jgi:hypothetical protein
MKLTKKEINMGEYASERTPPAGNTEKDAEEERAERPFDIGPILRLFEAWDEEDRAAGRPTMAERLADERFNRLQTALRENGGFPISLWTAGGVLSRIGEIVGSTGGVNPINHPPLPEKPVVQLHPQKTWVTMRVKYHLLQF